MIYLDNAATTAIRPEVLEAMMPFLSESYANPSSIYRGAGHAKMAIGAAREQVATAISAKPSEIFFTGSGSEAINWACKGIMFLNTSKKHIITTSVEHHASLYTIQSFEKFGETFEVTYLPVDEDGLVTAQQVQEALRPNTALVSIMTANNEVGTIMPIAEIGAVIKQANAARDKKDRIYFFTDAIQAVGHIPVNVDEMGVDLLAISAHKFYGPKGVGALYVRQGVKIAPLVHGGGQERGRRGGTENVPGIVGMGQAIELAVAEMAHMAEKHTKLRDYLIAQIGEKISHIKINGHKNKRLPNNVNVAFKGIEGEGILLLLDSKGFWASSGSACTSGSLEPSHVLLAMGLDHGLAHGSLRLSLGRDTTKEELDKLMEYLPAVINRLREMSPLWKA